MELYAYEIADALHLPRPRHNTLIRKIVTDSRQVEEHTLFAALRGEKCDGHDFVNRLDGEYKNLLFLTAKDMKTVQDDLVCADVLTALADIAKLYLSKLSALKVAVTGSVGKTTTKEMIACTLSGAFDVQKSLANRNNELGMPLTAFSVEAHHQAVIFEMGMRGKGQIHFLAERVRPDIGVITNIGTSHIELLGSRDNICAAKMELADCLAEDGILLLNGDEPLLRQAAERVKQKVLFFGLQAPADYFAEQIQSDQAGIRYTLVHKDKRYTIHLPAAGMHNVYNSLAAFAVAYEAGVSGDTIVKQLAVFRDGGLRQNIYTENGLTVFDDSYNASPESMRAALDVMKAYPMRKIAVLSDMLELGDYAKQAHFEVGRYAGSAGVDVLVCFGPLSENTVRGFDNAQKSVWFPEKQQALEWLLKNVNKDDMILFKGSHAMQCDKLLDDFKKRWSER